MWKSLLALAACLVAASAAAQPRPSSVTITCPQAAGLIAARGAVVLGTGGYTYDRFVQHRGFCLSTEATEPAWVPTRDTPQCFVGYRCKEADELFDR
jgi:opacity protein-like surface antigen